MKVEQAPWLWLCVVPDPPRYGQTRTTFVWNVKENRVEPSAADDDQFWLGVSAEGRGSKSSADRVAALFRHGTTPQDTMPVLTRDLIESIWVAFTSVTTDRVPAAAAPGRLLSFMTAHRGGIAFVREGGGPNTGDHDEELNRLMREQAASQPFGARVTRVTARRLGDGDPDEGGEGGVREPRQPLPDPPPIPAAIEPDEDQP